MAKSRKLPSVIEKNVQQNNNQMETTDANETLARSERNAESQHTPTTNNQTEQMQQLEKEVAQVKSLLAATLEQITLANKKLPNENEDEIPKRSERKKDHHSADVRSRKKNYEDESKGYRVDYQGKLRYRDEESGSSIREEYVPDREDYPSTAAYVRDMAEKAVKDLINRKGKRLLNDRNDGPEIVTPFTDKIMATKIPPHIKVPTMRYQGTTDPDNHLMAFNSYMDLYDASSAIRCRLFPVTLSGSAAKWYRQYRDRTIYSWKQFSYEFSAQFCTCKDPSIDYTVLVNMKQKPGESLGDYLKRFNAEALKAKDMNDRDKLIAVHAGLLENTPFWKELCIHGCGSLQDFHFQADKFIRMDESYHARKRNGSSRDPSRNNFDRRPKRPRWEDVPVAPADLNRSLSHIYTTTKGKLNYPIPSKAQLDPESRRNGPYCVYHRANGHSTDECRSLAGIIQKLIREGHLQQYVKRNNDSSSDAN